MAKRKSWRNRIVGEAEVAATELRPHPQNWREHPEFQRDAMSAVLDDVGWVQRVIVNKRTGHILDGHLRVEQAAAKGETVPVVYVSLTKPEEAAVLATFDPLASLAVPNRELLDQLIADARGLDLSPLTDELLGTLASPRRGITGEDDVPEIDKPERFEAGAIWALGNHRLACGDSTEPAFVAALLDDEVPPLMVTDPPYGVNYDPEWRAREAEKGNLSYAPTRTGEVLNDDRVDWTAAWQLSPSDVVYQWAPGGRDSMEHCAALEKAGYEVRSMIIWSKPHFPIGRGHYHWRHEPCWYGVRKGAKAHWIGDRKQTTVWDIALDKNVEGGHSTQKPVECMRRPIANHRGDVYDPFVGSGTTLIAAEQLGRRCFAADISPLYCEVAMVRWENFTGQKAQKLVKARVLA